MKNVFSSQYQTTCFSQSWPSSTLRDTVKPDDGHDWLKHVV